MAAVGEAGADRFRPHFLAIEWDDMVDAFKSKAAVVNSGTFYTLAHPHVECELPAASAMILPLRSDTTVTHLAKYVLTPACSGVGGKSALSAMVDDPLFAYLSFDAVLGGAPALSRCPHLHSVLVCLPGGALTGWCAYR